MEDNLAKLIAARLFIECDFKHGDGKLYRDDALDTWACLYGEMAQWEDVERELICMFGENYPTLGFVAHWKGGESSNPYRSWIYENLHD